MYETRQQTAVRAQNLLAVQPQCPGRAGGWERGDVLAPPSPALWQSQSWKLGCILHPAADVWQGMGTAVAPTARASCGHGAALELGLDLQLVLKLVLVLTLALVLELESGIGAGAGSGAGIGAGASVGTNASAGAQLGQAQILFSPWHFVFLK